MTFPVGTRTREDYLSCETALLRAATHHRLLRTRSVQMG